MANGLVHLLGDTQTELLSLLRRAPQTIAWLAHALDLSNNAVRSHIVELSRRGFVSEVGVTRETGGKPARRYALTAAGEELFPKAYAVILGALLEEITRTRSPDEAVALLDAVGRGVASGTSRRLDAAASTEQRVRAAAALLRELGADLEIRSTGGGWRLQGHGCPLSAVTIAHPDLCTVARAIVAAVTERPVTECCDRTGDRPRCAFAVS